MDWLYDKNGNAELFIYGNRFISKRGENLGWLYNGKIYGLKNGHHLGWFEDGVIYDLNNCVFAFLRDASGHLPYRPGLSGTPGIPGIPGSPGIPGFSGTYARPAYSSRWSTLTIKDFFDK